jgi:deoxyribodipyrimidine photo-lyase
MAKPAIWWIRRDLRLADNQALGAAMEAGRPVVPLFVLDPELLSSRDVSAKRLAFLWSGLQHLDADLVRRGGRLLVRRGVPAEQVAGVARSCGAEEVFAEEDYWPDAVERDRQVAEKVSLHLLPGLTVHHPDALRKADGSAYVMFTPFARAWQALSPPAASDMLPAPHRIETPAGLDSVPIPDEPAPAEDDGFPAGEAEAQLRLARFVADSPAPIGAYAQARDSLGTIGTSRLSPYLRFGMISARQTVAAALEAVADAPDAPSAESARAWLSELIWREFYLAIMRHVPRVLGESFRKDLSNVAWSNSEQLFQAWCAGRTGYPLVDAAMRELATTGWLHNRARMIAASFLVKDLLIDWRWGERYFMQHLLDGDPAANNGGWQWTAGTGTDAAPYFRVFNPVLQGKRHDPDGRYVRKWLPELSAVPAGLAHAPWEMSAEAQQSVRCVIGRDYPMPIVSHAMARQRALAAYQRARRGDRVT